MSLESLTSGEIIVVSRVSLSLSLTPYPFTLLTVQFFSPRTSVISVLLNIEQILDVGRVTTTTAAIIILSFIRFSE